MLAGQIVRLSWRMRRADRMQNAVMEYLAATRTPATSPALDLMRAMVAKRCGLRREDLGIEPEHAFGKIMAKDFYEELILNRMEQYEGRIERRLQKAMAEFHRWRLMRQMAEQEKSVPKAQGTSCKTNPNGRDCGLMIADCGLGTGSPCKTKPISGGMVDSPPASGEIAACCAEQGQVSGTEVDAISPVSGPVQAQGG
jgi:hypothetical protein